MFGAVDGVLARAEGDQHLTLIMYTIRVWSRGLEQEKVLELISRTVTKFDLAGRQALDAGFGGGRGGVYLDLSAEQYRKLPGVGSQIK